jgi:hypothetical protein
MSIYHVIPDGVGFQVVETLPDGSEGNKISFLTEEAAQRWLAELLGRRVTQEPPRPHREA